MQSESIGYGTCNCIHPILASGKCAADPNIVDSLEAAAQTLDLVPTQQARSTAMMLRRLYQGENEKERNR